MAKRRETKGFFGNLTTNQILGIIALIILAVVILQFSPIGQFYVRRLAVQQQQTEVSQTITLSPSDDAFTVGQHPNGQYGGGRTLDILATHNSWDSGSEIWLQFDIRGIPTSATISKAELSLTTIPRSKNLKVSYVQNGWNENTITHNTKPSLKIVTKNGNSDVANKVSSLPKRTDTWDVTDAVEDAMITGGGAVSLRVLSLGSLEWYYSDEHSDVADRPVLEITYSIPTPPGIGQPGQLPQLPTGGLR